MAQHRFGVTVDVLVRDGIDFPVEQAQNRQ
jgi:hypothetical protein